MPARLTIKKSGTKYVKKKLAASGIKITVEL
jgi:hypothetical protein